MDIDKLAEQILFCKEAAEYLGITVQRLNQLVHEDKIHCLKKNGSGTLFHIDELKKRQEEISIFSAIPNDKGGKGMFEINNSTKQEAVNYATVLEILKCSEAKVNSIFSELEKTIDISLPIDDQLVISHYTSIITVQPEVLLKQYKNTKQAFSLLKETDEIIKIGHQEYPQQLAQTEQAPRFLYLRGRKSLLSEIRTVSLVGSRGASEEAKNKTRKLAKMLGENGITVISGLAKGIDVTAHRASIEYGFNTIAVIGTNLNQYYPQENESVQREIEEKGLVISQFSPASQTQRWFFPLRNGVMSGLSLATVIMEAGETSGALKQADFALRQNRLIMIPESALKNTSITWPKKYVEKGAIVVKTPQDIILQLYKKNIYNIKGNSLPEQQSINDYLNIKTSETSLFVKNAVIEIS